MLLESYIQFVVFIFFIIQNGKRTLIEGNSNHIILVQVDPSEFNFVKTQVEGFISIFLLFAEIQWKLHSPSLRTGNKRYER